MMQIKVEINGVQIGFVDVVNISHSLLDPGIKNLDAYSVQGVRAQDGNINAINAGVLTHNRVNGALELAAEALLLVDEEMKKG